MMFLVTVVIPASSFPAVASRTSHALDCITMPIFSAWSGKAVKVEKHGLHTCSCSCNSLFPLNFKNIFSFQKSPVYHELIHHAFKWDFTVWYALIKPVLSFIFFTMDLFHVSHQIIYIVELTRGRFTTCVLYKFPFHYWIGLGIAAGPYSVVCVSCMKIYVLRSKYTV